MNRLTLRGLLGWSLMMLGISLVFHGAVPTCCIADDEAKTLATMNEAKIRAALKAPTDMNFDEMPLSEAIDYLKELRGIQIQIDQRALDEQGIATDTPMSFHCKELSLQPALQLLLRPLDLIAIVTNEVLLITTQEVADNWVEVRSYDVGSLIAKTQEPDADELASLLSVMIAPREKRDDPALAGETGGSGASDAVGAGGGSGGGGMFNVDVLAGPRTFAPRTAIIYAYNNVLIVRASIPRHEQLNQILETLTKQVRQID